MHLIRLVLILIVMVLSVGSTACRNSTSVGGGDQSEDGGDSGDDGSRDDDSGDDTSAELSAGDVRDFLWKPQADSVMNPGKLVIHADPCEVRVLVNGDELIDFGPGNGRCTTARSFSKSGCQYGANVSVQILDAVSGLPYLFPGGSDTYIIVNGCNRVEFKL